MTEQKKTNTKNELNTENTTKEMNPLLKQFKVFFSEFKEESDRAAVILGVARLDTLLYQLISKFLLSPPTSRDELLDGDSPLGTFSSRINICYRLGLIDTELTRSLHLIRRIRNAFAHETGISLINGGHADRIRQLTLPLVKYEEYERVKTGIFGEETNPSIDFRFILTICILRLEGGLNNSKSIEPDEQNICVLNPGWTKDKTKK